MQGYTMTRNICSHMLAAVSCLSKTLRWIFCVRLKLRIVIAHMRSQKAFAAKSWPHARVWMQRQRQSKAIHQPPPHIYLPWNLRISSFILYVVIASNSCSCACANTCLQYENRFTLHHMLAISHFREPYWIVGTQTCLSAHHIPSIFAAI